MKKIYATPNIITVSVKLANMITGSTNSISNERLGAGTSGSPVNLGRRGGDWDDED